MLLLLLEQLCCCYCDENADAPLTSHDLLTSSLIPSEEPQRLRPSMIAPTRPQLPAASTPPPQAAAAAAADSAAPKLAAPSAEETVCIADVWDNDAADGAATKAEAETETPSESALNTQQQQHAEVLFVDEEEVLYFCQLKIQECFNLIAE